MLIGDGDEGIRGLSILSISSCNCTSCTYLPSDLVKVRLVLS